MSEVIFNILYSMGHGYSIQAKTRTKLWRDLFNEHLTEMTYLASTAGFSINLHDDALGLQLEISGI